MRFIAHITLDTQRANQAARTGFQAIPEILAQQKPGLLRHPLGNPH